MFDALKQISALRGALDGAADLQSLLPLLAGYGVTGEVISRDLASINALLKGVVGAVCVKSAETVRLTGEVNGRRLFAVIVSAEPVEVMENPALPEG